MLKLEVAQLQPSQSEVNESLTLLCTHILSVALHSQCRWLGCHKTGPIMLAEYCAIGCKCLGAPRSRLMCLV